MSQTTPPTLTAEDRFLTIKEVKERIPKGTSTIYRWMEEGRFPRAHSIGPGSVAWLEREIVEWMRSAVGGANR